MTIRTRRDAMVNAKLTSVSVAFAREDAETIERLPTAPHRFPNIKACDVLLLVGPGKKITKKVVTKSLVNRINKENRMAKRKKAAATAPRAKYRIEWWVSEKDGDHYAAATCVENGEEVWRQSEGIKRRIDMMTVIDRLFLGLWPVTKLKATTTKDR